MGIATSEDTSFLIYAYIRKGDYVAINSLVVALVQGPNGVREVVLEDKGKCKCFT